MQGQFIDHFIIPSFVCLVLLLLDWWPLNLCKVRVVRLI